MSDVIILGIETTCDETACAIVKNGREILSNIISSQIDLHAQYGGVVPELSCRRHIDVLIPTLKKALNDAHLSLSDIDVIAVAHGPGLIGALLIGINAAKALSLATNIPFVGINHVEAHLYAAVMSHPTETLFPCIGIVASGGHTTLVRIDEIGSYTLIGQTIDDAIGEAFDKVAKILGLPYPGGPQIEQLALKGDKQRFAFKGGKVKGKPFDFSFSGLKTAVLYALKGQNLKLGFPKDFTEQDKADLSASFQEAALSDLVNKAALAAKEHSCHTLVFGGGVTNNRYLRRMVAEKAPHLQAIWPSVDLSLDNAAMIAGLGYHKYKSNGTGDPLDLEAFTRLPFY